MVAKVLRERERATRLYLIRGADNSLRRQKFL
jgi:hypothetical protein